MKTIAALVAFAGLIGIGLSGTEQARRPQTKPAEKQLPLVAVQPVQPTKEQAKSIAKQPPGLPPSVHVTISLDPTSPPEGTDNPNFAGYVVQCNWNGAFYRGVSTDGLLLADLIYNDPDVGGWQMSYTGYACARALGIQYAICDGWHPISKTNAPWSDPSGTSSTICKRIKKAFVPPNPLPLIFDATYDVRYQFSVGP